MRVARIIGGVAAALLACTFAGGCSSPAAGPAGDGSPEPAAILADTSFLADIAQSVAGDRLVVSSLIPVGADPHSFEPTPKDAQRVAGCRALVVNVLGLLPGVDGLVTGVGGSNMLVIEAAAGLPGLQADPHCWLDPLLVVTYAENIARGFTEFDPAGASTYSANAAAYAATLLELDSWIKSQLEIIPAERRLLVTNHESLGRFAARYGFQIVGAIFPTATGEGSPSARQLTELVDSIKAAGAPAIFVETGSNTDLAEQLGAEAGVTVVTDLYTHSLGEGASTYIEMMRWNVTKIVEAMR